jgi:hypothetical protein
MAALPAPMLTAQATYRMLANQTLWDAAVECHATLDAAGIPHAIAGGVAVCLHGYRRNTVDLDLLVRRDDQGRIRSVLEASGYSWSAEQAEFRAPSGVQVQFLLSGERAGKGAEVLLPEPDAPGAIVEIEGLDVLALAKLIEVKLACGLGSPRRTHRDLADVVELIAIHQLGRDFARHLHKSLRPAFRKLVLQSRG